MWWKWEIFCRFRSSFQSASRYILISIRSSFFVKTAEKRLSMFSDTLWGISEGTFQTVGVDPEFHCVRLLHLRLFPFLFRISLQIEVRRIEVREKRWPNGWELYFEPTNLAVRYQVFFLLPSSNAVGRYDIGRRFGIKAGGIQRESQSVSENNSLQWALTHRSKVDQSHHQLPERTTLYFFSIFGNFSYIIAIFRSSKPYAVFIHFSIKAKAAFVTKERWRNDASN